MAWGMLPVKLTDSICESRMIVETINTVSIGKRPLQCVRLLSHYRGMCHVLIRVHRFGVQVTKVSNCFELCFLLLCEPRGNTQASVFLPRTRLKCRIQERNSITDLYAWAFQEAVNWKWRLSHNLILSLQRPKRADLGCRERCSHGSIQQVTVKYLLNLLHTSNYMTVFRSPSPSSHTHF